MRELADRSPASAESGFQVALLEDDVLAEPALAAIATGAPRDAWREIEAETTDTSSEDSTGARRQFARIAACSAPLPEAIPLALFRQAPLSLQSISRRRAFSPSIGRTAAHWS
jgi:hypothetical protein